MKNIKVSLAWQILIALVLGILLGSYLHYHSDSREWLIANLLSPAGDIFIHLIKMIVGTDCDLDAGGRYCGRRRLRNS
ncbi:sodium:dicarboxylate symporter [Enterobacter asburiae]|uniref:Sodium:dicarboxylate symporter n=1 Tax=Enterobacter asburiae TaxID=61645 RepID=A0A376FFQ9_ENTAS|nr:sodium:dicarboxylate symporter [Enterobacter asburiae]